MVDIENIERKENYSIPEGYFEAFPGKVLQRIEKEKMKRKTRWVAAGVAAAAVLALSTTLFFTYNTNDNSKIIAEQTTEVAPTEEDALESLATDYYSEELAMMDFYTMDY